MQIADWHTSQTIILMVGLLDAEVDADMGNNCARATI
jgi:hypothetical protein